MAKAPRTVFVFPVPGTLTASAATTISFRGIGRDRVGTVHVNGTASGPHAGRWLGHSDGDGVSFVPTHPFTAGETVRVATSLHLAGATGGDFTFGVAHPASSSPPPPSSDTPANTEPPQSFASRPDLRPPPLRVDASRPGAADGDVFLAPFTLDAAHSQVQSGPMIVDGSGNLVWFAPEQHSLAFDLEAQQYRGHTVLTWFEGSVTSQGYGQGEHVIADDSYRAVARVHAGNGYQADLHDFLLTPKGTALMTAYNPVMLPAADTTDGESRAVLDAVVQEVDIPTGGVIFEWHSVGTIPLADSYANLPKTTTEAYDYVHPNSVALDKGGDIWLSARHTYAVYKLDRRSAAIVWRLGGKHSDFDVPAAARFAWQHDVRPHPDGVVTVFDNASGPGPSTHSASRGLELRVDESTRKVTLLRSAWNPHGKLANSQGSFQMLPNGDTFAGWGAVGEYTEWAPDGSVRLDVSIQGGSESYRALRLPWTGYPTGHPDAVANMAGGQVKVAVSWNGATEVGALARPRRARRQVAHAGRFVRAPGIREHGNRARACWHGRRGAGARRARQGARHVERRHRALTRPVVVRRARRAECAAQ